jgi:hypothetical protein
VLCIANFIIQSRSRLLAIASAKNLSTAPSFPVSIQPRSSFCAGGGRRAKEALEPVGHNVVCDHPAHPWLEGGGANDQPAAEGEAHQRDRVEAEEVQHRFDRLLPLRTHGQVRQFERRSLAGALEQDRVVAGVAKDQRCGQPFLDVTVEPAEYDKRALGLRRGEAIGGQPAGFKGNAAACRGRNLK